MAFLPNIQGIRVTGSLTGMTSIVVTGQGLTATTVSATTYQNLPQEIFVTGATYSNNTFTFTNSSGGTFGVLFNTVTGLTANSLTVTGDTRLSGLTANTISATTYLNLPVTSDTRVTGATYSNNTITFTNNTGGTFNVLFNTVTGWTVNGNLAVTGTTSVTGNTTLRAVTATTATISSATQNILTVIGSGNSSTSPIFSVQGSQGQLFAVSDSLTGSLFSVNDISGLPILEVFSDTTTLMGSYLAPSLNTTVRVSAATGTTNIYSIPTSAYTGAFYDYTLSGSTGLRAGNVMAIWSGSTAQYTESSTLDIGNTAAVTFNVVVSSGSAILRSSATTSGWIIRTIIRSI